MAARKSEKKRDVVDALVSEWENELPDLDFSGVAVFGRLHRDYHRYAARIEEVFNRYGINAASFTVLAPLGGGGPPYRRTAGDLANTGLVTTGGLTLRLD